mgnify:CR=1 FL=1
MEVQKNSSTPNQTVHFQVARVNATDDSCPHLPVLKMFTKQKPGVEVQKKCFNTESNYGPSDLQSDALPTELLKRVLGLKVLIWNYKHA